MTEREKLLSLQVRVLADRLALALSIMQDCEVVAGVDGDSESADWWEEQRRMLVGKDEEAVRFARAEQRQCGFYRASITQIRSWLKRGITEGKQRRAA